MKKIITKRLLVKISLALLLGGCTAAQSNMVEQGSVPVKIIGGGAAKIVEVSAVRSGDELVINGRVERMFSSPIRGHVDLAIYGREGEVLQMASVNYFPRATKGSGKNRASFTARLPLRTSDAGVVRASYHGKPHQAQGLTDCGENAAVRGG